MSDISRTLIRDWIGVVLASPQETWRDQLLALLATVEPEREQPRYLRWPTEYFVITQPFGAAPAYYSKFALPGHEGLDIRAPGGSKVFAVADGVVTRVDHAHPAYGLCIRHSLEIDGIQYEAIYAHGQRDSDLVRVGETVKAGQLLMLADATGNVIQGRAHLHYSMKRPGRPWTDARGREWPYNLIDPTGFFDMAGVQVL